MNAIPSFPISEASSPEARETFRRLGADTPMIALSGAPVSAYHIDHVGTYRPLGKDEERFFLATCVGALATISDQTATALVEDYDGEPIIHLPKQADSVHHNIVLSHKGNLLGRRRVATHTALGLKELHLDLKSAHPFGVAYGMHLTVSGEGQVGAAHSRDIDQSTGYYPGISPEDAISDGHASLGDLHIFIRQSSKVSGKLPTYHGFGTDSNQRHHIQGSFGVEGDW